MAKRKLEQDFDVSEVDAPCSDVNIHGVVTELSPVKVSRKNVKYFDGKLSDGKKSMRIVSFEPVLRDEMDKSRLEKSPVAIMKCQVKEKMILHNSNTEPFEILASKRSKVQNSPHKINLPDDVQALDPDSQSSPIVQLNDIDAIAAGEHITVSGKVIQLNEPFPVQNKAGKMLTIQESIFADVSRQIRLVSWENQTGQLVINNCYKLENVTVQLYNGCQIFVYIECYNSFQLTCKC